MKHFNRFIAAFLVVLLLVSLAACAPKLAAPAVTTMPEAFATPTPTLTPEPTEVPTPAVDEYGFTEERKAELNQQILDFLSYQGEYTKEKIFSMMMETSHPFVKKATGLGISTYQPEIQGYFFDYFEKENRIILLIGFDGKDGKRFITPVEIYLFENPDYPDASGFGFYKYYANDLEQQWIEISVDEWEAINGEEFYESGVETVSVVGDYREYIGCEGRGGTTSFLDSLRNNVIALWLNQWTQTEAEILAPIEGELLEYYQQEYGADFDPAPFEAFNRDVLLDYYLTESNPKVELSVGLIELVVTNDFDYGILDLQTKGNTSAIIKIDSAFNLDDIDISKVPILASIYFYEGILDRK